MSSDSGNDDSDGEYRQRLAFRADGSVQRTSITQRSAARLASYRKHAPATTAAAAVTVASPLTVEKPILSAADITSTAAAFSSQESPRRKHSAPDSRGGDSDLFCPSDVVLHIRNGFIYEKQLYALTASRLDPGDSANTTRTYTGLSLLVESRPAGGDALTFASSDAGSSTKTILRIDESQWLPMAPQVIDSNSVGVVAMSGTRGSDRWPQQQQQHPSLPQVLLIVVLPTADVANRVRTLLEGAIERKRQRFQSSVGRSTSTSSLLARETLSSVRQLQDRTLRMLDDLRADLLPETPQLSSSAAAAAGMLSSSEHLSGGAPDHVCDIVERRQRLSEVYAVVKDIQSRRHMRADVVQQLLISDTVADVAAVGEVIGDYRDQKSLQRSAHSRPSSSSLLLSPTTAPNAQRESFGSYSARSSGLREHPRSFRDIRPDGEILCKHCGNALQSHGEKRRHEPVCAYRLVRCRKCSTELRVKDFRRHRETKCRQRLIKPSSASQLRRDSSRGSLQEVSSSSMEELDDDDEVQGRRSTTPRKQRSSLHEVHRESSQFDSLTSPRGRDSSDQRRLSSSQSRFSSSSLRELDRSRSPESLQRHGSVVESVQTRCIHCGRRAPASHVARCAYRRIACAICGAEVIVKEAAQHAATHRTTSIQDRQPSESSPRFRPKN